MDDELKLTRDKQAVEREIALLGENIRKELIAEAQLYELEELTYLYRDAATKRDYEIRYFERIDDNGTPVMLYFLTELIPTGRMVKTTEAGDVTHLWDEPLIETMENLFGTNRLMNELATVGLDTTQMVRLGGGLGPGSRYYETLGECTLEIARSIVNNERYQHFTPLTEQQKVRMEFESVKSAHAYWLERKNALDFSNRVCEEGLFKGCTGLFGEPLDMNCKKEILAFLNAPSKRTWLIVRSALVIGEITLWDAWCAFDATATRSGPEGFPNPEVLRAALRTAVEKRAEEIDSRLAELSPTGLRLVA